MSSAQRRIHPDIARRERDILERTVQAIAERAAEADRLVTEAGGGFVIYLFTLVLGATFTLVTGGTEGFSQ